MDQNETLSGQEGEQEELQGEPVNQNSQSMEALLENDAFSVELPKSGEIREGTIASVSEGQILVSIGAKSEGIISGRELEMIDSEVREAFDVGQEIPVFVVSPEDSNGNVVLSYKRAQEHMAWVSVEEQMEEDNIVDSKIIGYNKGGLIVDVYGLRGFVPASQISALRRIQAVGDTPEQRWAKMINEPISVRIIEVDKSRRRLICSERAADSESRQSIKERVIEELEEGEVHTGRVTSLADFGAFVNINGADGLVHLSELSWDRIQHPKEILEVGQEVKVKVINIDRDKKRIGLSLRALTDDPWRSRIEKYSVGQLVEGVITRLTKFGAFARLESDIEGLIHISEISETRIEHPKEVLKEGEVVALRIIRVDPEQHRIGLSLRKVDSAAFADKDFKMLAKEIDRLEEEEPEPEMSEEEIAAAKPTEEESSAEPEAVMEETAEVEGDKDEATEEKPAEEETSTESEPEPAKDELVEAEATTEETAEVEGDKDEAAEEKTAEDETSTESEPEPAKDELVEAEATTEETAEAKGDEDESTEEKPAEEEASAESESESAPEEASEAEGEPSEEPSDKPEN
jgi:small subunit ribosomal protein S1